jgi:SAM-dependent methyltransferase
MAKRVPDKIEAALRVYLADVKVLPNEPAKRQRFAALVGELVEDKAVVAAFAQGTERLVRIDLPGRSRGFVDSYYGNAVIEFENSLRATGEHAEEQLREYVAGLWGNEKHSRRPLIAVATDGLVWRTYRPEDRSDGLAVPTTDQVKLNLLRELTLTKETLADFWMWFSGLLHRPGQLEPSIEQFRIDFGATSITFHDAMDALRDAWGRALKTPEARLAFKTWVRYLTVTYGQLGRNRGVAEDEAAALGDDGLVTLFLKHTYLASMARLLVWAALSGGKIDVSLRSIADVVFSGRYFESQRVANIAEDDFFQWIRETHAAAVLTPVWERALDQLLTYDLARLREDVLKGVYQELVHPIERHELGEYYTPDWLCDRIVNKLLPSQGWARVLDPSCGSGSFLRAAIHHFLSANPGRTSEERLHSVLHSVVGIDIHPLAVIISRATYLLALGPLVKVAPRPIQIPVYMADSLFLPAEVRQMEMLEGGFEVKFGGRRVLLPVALVEAAEQFDAAIAGCSAVAADHVRTGIEDRDSLRAYLAGSVPLLDDKEGPPILESLWEFTLALAGLIRQKDNSIWAFIVRNAYRPAMLKGRFDYIVGNPPWLSYRFISEPDYQDEVKRWAVEKYKIAPKAQRLITQMELATVFLAHCLSTFGKPGARLGFVMPRSLFSADQHSAIRDGSHFSRFTLRELWDLWDVAPLFRVPACVIFAEKWTREEAHGTAPRPPRLLPLMTWQGKLKTRDVTWLEAAKTLVAKRGVARLVYLGRERTAWSAGPGRTRPNEPSPYKKEFRQGATLVPRNFYFVRVRDLPSKPAPETEYYAETDPEQARKAKEPYRGVRLWGMVPGKYLYATALADHLLPFAVLQQAMLALPLERLNQRLALLTADDLRKKGDRSFARWIGEAEAIWHDKREEKAGSQSLYERLDYQKGLSGQTLAERHLVLYNRSGTNVSAAHFDRSALPIPFVVDTTLSWAALPSATEADYLTAVLNCESINDAVKPFQSTGLMGERDVYSKVLELPIPRYTPGNSRHHELAGLGRQAQARTDRFVRQGRLPRTLAARRALVRSKLADLLQAMDEIVRKLI